MSRVSAPIFRCSRAPCTASRWSISTTRTRRRNRSAVIEAVDDFYRRFNANVARAVHTLGDEATTAYEATRDKLARFINAPSRDEIVFTSGTTQAINLVAYSYLLPRLEPGDEIVVTTMEHHANIVPWQILVRSRRREAQGRADHREGRADRREVHRAPDAAREARRRRARLERARHDQSGRRARARGAQARHSAARRRLAGDAAPAGRRARARLRFLRADRPQDVRPDRHRRAVGAQGTPARHAAVLRRRRDDPRGALRRHDVSPIRRTGSRPARRTSRASSGSARRSTTSNRSAASASRPAEHELLDYATAALKTVPGLRIFGEARATRPR